eukprot:scaffold10062_cov99-Isochrysis_galbana.AAC.3
MAEITGQGRQDTPAFRHSPSNPSSPALPLPTTPPNRLFLCDPTPNSTPTRSPHRNPPPFYDQVRSTLNGFSAACGKLGATIGTSSFKPLKDSLTRAYGEAAGAYS